MFCFENNLFLALQAKYFFLKNDFALKNKLLSFAKIMLLQMNKQNSALYFFSLLVTLDLTPLNVKNGRKAI
jgi:hypothetical protein